MTNLIHELIHSGADRTPDAAVLRDGRNELSYGMLASEIYQAANLFLGLGLARRDRVAVYMDKRIDTVVAMFGAAAAGGVFVPVNPLLKAEQVAYFARLQRADSGDDIGASGITAPGIGRLP